VAQSRLARVLQVLATDLPQERYRVQHLRLPELLLATPKRQTGLLYPGIKLCELAVFVLSLPAYQTGARQGLPRRRLGIELPIFELILAIQQDYQTLHSYSMPRTPPLFGNGACAS